MTRHWISCLSSLLLVVASARSSSAATKFVGGCGTPNFSTINSAVTAAASGDTVKVCPGTYAEQVSITKPLTLEGVISASADLARITPPSTGLAINATVDNLNPAAAQIYVNHVTGTVNVSNLYVDGTNNQVGAGVALIIGVLYQESSGTINHVTTAYQEGNDGGFGIYALGGPSNPSVTIENCSIRNFDLTGILAIGQSTKPDITTTLKNNFVGPDPASLNTTYGIASEVGSNDTVTGNVIERATFGIEMDMPAGSVTNNYIGDGYEGIVVVMDGPPVKSNHIYKETYADIQLATPLNLSQIQNNMLYGDTTQQAIDLNCDDSGTLVSANTIMDHFIGFANVPTSFKSTNTYYNVGVELEPDSCSNPHRSGRSNAALSRRSALGAMHPR